MHESFTFWFPSVWTLFGALFTIFSFFLDVFLAFGRRDSISPQLGDILSVLRDIQDQPASLREVQSDDSALTKAVTALGQSHAEMLGTLRESMTDFQALANEFRKVHEAVTRSKTDSQVPATPVLLEMLETLRASMTDFQALASEVREIREAVTRSMTDPQAPATPVLPEILAELRKMTKGGPQIQRGLRPFSLQVFLEAQAKVLARERIQATPNPFHDLD